MRINKLTDYGIVVMTRIAAMENDKIHTAKEISTNVAVFGGWFDGGFCRASLEH